MWLVLFRPFVYLHHLGPQPLERYQSELFEWMLRFGLRLLDPLAPSLQLLERLERRLNDCPHSFQVCPLGGACLLVHLVLMRLDGCPLVHTREMGLGT